MQNTWSKEAIYKYHKLTEKDCKVSKTSKGIFRVSRRFIKGAILDIGAGKGDLARFLKMSGFENITAIDLVGKTDLGVIEMDSCALKFSNGSFDTVLCTDVIEHLSEADLNSTIFEIARVLRKGGSAIITTLYKEDLKESIFFCPQCHKFAHAYGHQQVFDEQRIRELLRKFNLTVTKMQKLHFGAYTLFPRVFSLVHKTGMYKALPEDVRKLFNRDFLIVAKK